MCISGAWQSRSFHSQKKYITVKTDPLILSILEGEVSSSGLLAGSSLSKQEVELLGQDIRYIKEAAEFYSIGRRLYQDWLYLFSYFIPIISLVLAWRYSAYRNKLRGNIGLARRRKAGPDSPCWDSTDQTAPDH